MSVFFTNRKKFFQVFQKDRRLPSEFCTSRRLSYAPMAGFSLRSNKAVKGEVIVNYYESLIIRQGRTSALEDPAKSGEMKASGSLLGEY